MVDAEPLRRRGGAGGLRQPPRSSAAAAAPAAQSARPTPSELGAVEERKGDQLFRAKYTTK